MFRPLLLAAVPLALFSLPAFAAPDPAFLDEAMKGDNGEVAMGRMAQRQAASPRVRAYGAMLMRDHGMHKVKVAALVRTMGGHASGDLTPDAMQARDMLQGMRGRAFDAAFKAHMIEDHQKDIAKYEAQASETRNPRVRALARATLPTLRKHLAAARAL